MKKKILSAIAALLIMLLSPVQVFASNDVKILDNKASTSTEKVTPVAPNPPEQKEPKPSDPSKQNATKSNIKPKETKIMQRRRCPPRCPPKTLEESNNGSQKNLEQS